MTSTPTPQTPDHVPSEGVETAIRILKTVNRSGHMPGCMMPDGAEPCEAFYEQDEAIRAALDALATALSSSAAAGSAGEDTRSVANVMEALWRDAEDEVARLAAGFWPSDKAIAEAFHEHRRETQPSLPPWSDVMEGSGIWQHSHNFATRLASLRPTHGEAL
jgi:hypothetical protein